ncbi:hypothetical protein AGMMS49982_02160 [Bacteroidia bacterium]|nr:hypothetical protein AGMMS49982_02160 [Bacteroidia bacterium]
MEMPPHPIQRTIPANKLRAASTGNTIVKQFADSVVTVKADGTPSDKQIYQYDEYGHITSFENYAWSGDSWYPAPISKDEYEYDVYGNRTKHTEYTWDGYTWEKTAKEERAYDANGNQTLSADYYWYDTDAAWIGSGTKTESVYDAHNLLTSEASYSWVGSDWEGQSKYEYTYDEASGKETSVSISNWTGTGWEFSRLTTTGYDAQGNETLLAAWDWDGASWVEDETQSFKYTYTYDPSTGKALDYTYSKLDGAGGWTMLEDGEYYYENGTTTKYYGWDDDNERWLHEYEYAYDARGNQILSASRTWTDSWQGSAKYVATYDTLNHPTSRIDYTWVGSVWVASNKKETVYDARGNLLAIAEYDWNGSGWVGSSKYEYRYVFGERQTTAEYHWDASANFNAGGWAVTFKNLYDAMGNQTSAESYYNPSGGAWVGVVKTTYEYNSDGKNTSSVEYSWNNNVWEESGRYKIEYVGDTAKKSNYTGGSWVPDEISTYYYEAHEIQPDPTQQEQQVIPFVELPAKAYGDAPVILPATSDKGLPISYESKNPAVATIVDDSVLTIVGVGSVEIVATQAGNYYIAPATPVTRTLTVGRAPQTFTFEAFTLKMVGDEPIELSSTTTNKGLPITYTSKNPNVATVDGNIVTIVGAGSVEIVAEQAGDSNHLRVIQMRTLNVNSGTPIKKVAPHDVEVYPNPVRDVLFIKSDSGIEKVEFYNQAGQFVLKDVSSSDKINVSNLGVGFYLVRITVDGTVVTKKIIVKH